MAHKPTLSSFRFGIPLTVGTDICSIDRVHSLLRRRGARFADRILSPTEPRPHFLSQLPEVLRTPDRAPATLAAATFLAGRFAAKEAIIKAYGHLRLGFHDIEIHYRNKDSLVSATERQRDSKLEPSNLSKLASGVCLAAVLGVSELRNSALLSSASLPDQDIDEKSCDTNPKDTVSSSIELSCNIRGPPFAIVLGKHISEISISHDGSYAAATCLAWHGKPQVQSLNGTDDFTTNADTIDQRFKDLRREYQEDIAAMRASTAQAIENIWERSRKERHEQRLEEQIDRQEFDAMKIMLKTLYLRQTEERDLLFERLRRKLYKRQDMRQDRLLDKILKEKLNEKLHGRVNQFDTKLVDIKTLKEIKSDNGKKKGKTRGEKNGRKEKENSEKLQDKEIEGKKKCDEAWSKATNGKSAELK